MHTYHCNDGKCDMIGDIFYMMTDENITANADKKILFWYNETEYVHD